MRELKRFAWFAAALVLCFSGTVVAGEFANSTVAFDLEIDNLDGNDIPTNEGNLDTTLSLAAGDRFEADFFVVPAPEVPLLAVGIEFAIDSTVIELNRVSNEGEDGWLDNFDPPGTVIFSDVRTIGFDYSYGTGESFASLVHPGYVIPEGYGGTIRFEAVGAIDTELVIGPSLVAFSDTSSGGAARDTLFAGPAVSSSSSQIQLGGSATVSLTGYVPPIVLNGTSNTLDWEVTSTGNATVTVEGQSGTTFSTAPTAQSIVLNSSGSGAASVTVAVTIGDDTYTSAAITFEEATPVELASFGGEVIEERVVLNWATGSQTNNAGWRVLRSEDGENYAAVGQFVSGAGTSEELLSYTFDDPELPESESVFYVLEQVDLDGSVHLSDPIEVLLGARFSNLPESFGISAYPNPFNPSTTVSYDLPSDEQVTIVIYDVLGQEVRRLVDDARAAGRYSIQWDARDNRGRSVGSGVYIARIDAGTFSQSQKMLLLK